MKNKKMYDLYQTQQTPNGAVFSDFCYRYEKKEQAVMALGFLLGKGMGGYIDEVTFEVVEHVRRLEFEY